MSSAISSSSYMEDCVSEISSSINWDYSSTSVPVISASVTAAAAISTATADPADPTTTILTSVHPAVGTVVTIDTGSTVTTTEVFTTTYTYCNQAADSTTIWYATYTIIEVVCGDSATWTQPAIPPNFIETVVEVNKAIVTITCPVDQSAHTGTVTISGNGVTATAATPAHNAGTGTTVAATVATPAHNAGAGTTAIATIATPVHKAGDGTAIIATLASSPATHRGSGTASAKTGGNAPPAGPAIPTSPAAPVTFTTSANTVTGARNNSSSGTTSAGTGPSPIVTAGAPSIKNSLSVAGAAFLLLVPFLM